MNKTDALKRAAELRQIANRLHRLEIDCVVRARELEHQATLRGAPLSANAPSNLERLRRDGFSMPRVASPCAEA